MACLPIVNLNSHLPLENYFHCSRYPYYIDDCFGRFVLIHFQKVCEERSSSVVECLTADQEIVGFSLIRAFGMS